MNYRLAASRRFERRLRRFLRKHPELRNQLDSVFQQLQQDPFQSRLHLHPLRGELQGYHAVRIDYSNRLVLILNLEERNISLVDIGTHDEVYR